jgi:hypothetical protein
MLKKYEVENQIIAALEEWDGLISDKPDEDGNYTIFESKVSKDDNGDFILSFKEDCLSDDKPDKYRIKIEYYED